MISERLYEVILVVVVVVIVLAFGIAELRDFVRESRKVVLKADLRNLRNAIALHHASTNTYPATLEQAASSGTGGLGENVILVLYNTDNKGCPRDPFGKRYFYDPATGEVRSRTPGYDKY
jgi:type II secretory pathway pseudopilin PulG